VRFAVFGIFILCKRSVIEILRISEAAIAATTGSLEKSYEFCVGILTLSALAVSSTG